MRERGSSTARPTEKGVGGLPIGARPVDFGASIRSRPVDFVAICGLPLGVSVDSVVSRRVVSIRSRPVDSVASCRFGVLLVSRFGRFGASIRSSRSSQFGVLLVSRFGRFGRVVSRRSQGDTKDKTQKKPDSSIGESGCSYRKASRALNLPLAPLSNTRASARSVRLGLARRSCIVMPTSARRRIGRYI